jgi:uncharacterized membrane protein YqhA
MEKEKKSEQKSKRSKLSLMIENVFETMLFSSRFITMLAVLGSLIASITMFIKSTLQVIRGIRIFIGQLSSDIELPHEALEIQNNEIVALMVSSVDEYLFATVLLIFSMGIYELFISEIDPASRKDDTRPNWLKISSIDDLKNSLGKVILMVLIVSFFEQSLKLNKFSNALDLLYFGLGVLFVSAALYLAHADPKHKREKSHPQD